SPPPRTQGQPVLLAVLSQGTSGEVFAPTISVAMPSAGSATVGAVPSGSPWITSVRPMPDDRIDSGSNDSLPQAFEDDLPASLDENASPYAALFGPDQEAAPEVQSVAALWREASTAYFAAQGAAAGSPERAVACR